MSENIDQLVEEQLKSGKYRTREELLVEALHVLKARDSELERMRGRIRESLAEADRGELVDGLGVFQSARERVERYGRDR